MERPWPGLSSFSNNGRKAIHTWPYESSVMPIHPAICVHVPLSLTYGVIVGSATIIALVMMLVEYGHSDVHGERNWGYLLTCHSVISILISEGVPSARLHSRTLGVFWQNQRALRDASHCGGHRNAGVHSGLVDTMPIGIPFFASMAPNAAMLSVVFQQVLNTQLYKNPGQNILGYTVFCCILLARTVSVSVHSVCQ